MFVNKEKRSKARQARLPKPGTSGQALMIVVLVMTVALTIGLSLTSRSIVDLRTSSEEADSQKALAAADAGIDVALVSSPGQISKGFVEIGSSYKVDIKEAKGVGPFLLNNGNLVPQGEGIDIWLVDHKDLDGDGEVEPDYSNTWDGQNRLDIYWGTNDDPCENAALEISVIEGTALSPSLKRYAVDRCGDRAGDNKFSDQFATAEVNTIEGITLKHKWSKNIAPGSNAMVVRVAPVYTNAIIGVSASANLPTQGFYIDSTGTSASGSNREVKRSISLFKQYAQLPSVYFNYGLFSP